jgi:4-hydroxythreonine-4-phosphate dehydrogenase
MKKPVIGISMGDPAGIGPEICLKSLSDYSNYERCNPLIIGDATLMKLTTEHFGYELKNTCDKRNIRSKFHPRHHRCFRS